MEIEPGIVKQCKCHLCCICKNYGGKVVEDGEKHVHCFSAYQKIMSLWGGKHFGASYSSSNRVLLVAGHMLNMSLKNALKGTVDFKFTVALF